MEKVTAAVSASVLGPGRRSPVEIGDLSCLGVYSPRAGRSRILTKSVVLSIPRPGIILRRSLSDERRIQCRKRAQGGGDSLRKTHRRKTSIEDHAVKRGWQPHGIEARQNRTRSVNQTPN